MKQVLKTLNIVQGQVYKDIRMTECITLLFKDVVITTFPMEHIDNHLKSIVNTRLSSYIKSGNMEDLWEDLIFMNHIIGFKQLIEQSKVQADVSHLIKLEYGVHLPIAETLGELIKKSIEIHMRNFELSKAKDNNIPKTPMRDSIGLCCLHLLFKVALVSLKQIMLNKEKLSCEIPSLMTPLIDFVMNSNFFITSKRDTSDMKNPIMD